MTRLLVVGFGPYPGCPANPSQEVVETLRAEAWAPAGARVALAIAPSLWWRAVEVVAAAATRAAPDALLLVGHAPGAEGLLVAGAALNAAGVTPDAAGLRWPGREIAPGGPERLAVTLPARPLARVITAGEVPAEEIADGGDYIWNRCLYAALAAGAAPLVGLLLAPTPLETARGLGGGGPARLNRGQILAGVQAGLRWAGAVAARPKAAA